MTKSALAATVESTLLRPDAELSDFTHLCHMAIQYGFYAVCVPSSMIPLAKDILNDHPTKIVSVAGFPCGNPHTEIKAKEAKLAIELGAHEIDVVIHLGYLKSKQYEFALKDIQTVVDIAGEKPVKVILETGILNKAEKIAACIIAKEAGARFIKTSTGFNGPGATVEDVALLSYVVGRSMGVKASGGIRSFSEALKMIQAGAARIGTSSGEAMILG